MRYEVGDKVRVRKDLEEGKRYGGLYFNSSMANLKGKLVTVEALDGNHCCIKEGVYFWTDEMFEPVITNWDKVKEEYTIEDFGNMSLCKAIRNARNEVNCNNRTCEKCYEWLKQPYKEPSVLDEAEKKYLSAVIRPWRNKVKWITKEDGCEGEFISIRIKKKIQI